MGFSFETAKGTTTLARAMKNPTFTPHKTKAVTIGISHK
jgi:hypothetical protein